MKKQDYSKILEDFDHSRNIDIDPYILPKTSTKKIWWKCKKRHVYQVSFYSRIRSNGCKICNNPQKIENIRIAKLKIGRSFADAQPNLLKEWDYSKNDLTPDKISERSNIKIWFKCLKGHLFQATPKARSRGTGCPKCYEEKRGAIIRESKLKKRGITLLDEFPDLMKEWDYNLNTNDPSKLSSGSNILVHWKCNFGHSWQAKIYNRTGKESGCPFCKSSTSKLEVYILCEMKKFFTDVEWRSKINGFECDILIQDINVGIEVDGAYWHDNKIERDLTKHKVFRENGIHLIRVRDSSLPEINNSIIYDKNTQYIDIVIEVLKVIQKINPSFNFHSYISNKIQLGVKEYNKTLSLLPAPTEKESLSFINPSLSMEWDYEKNNPLTPAMFTANSEKKVFWKCKKHNSWEASIKNRHKNKSGCPSCYRDSAGSILRKALLKKRGISLVVSHPYLLKEWDYDLNTYNPSELTPGSSVKIHWKCEYGHKWQSPVVSRTSKSYGCPICMNNNRSVRATEINIRKTGTFANKHPELLKEWDYGVNKKDPSEFPPGSSKRVGWKCAKGHKWEATIKSRNKGGGTCPSCQSIANQNSQLLKEWDFQKNKNIDPHTIHSGSKIKVWWICKTCDHSWNTAIANRTTGNLSSCPLCGIKKSTDTYKKTILKNRGSVKEKYPILMKYWDKEKNDKQGYSADLMTCGSRIKIFWHCPNCNHKWQSSVNDRTNSKYTCPKCKFEKITKG